MRTTSTSASVVTRRPPTNCGVTPRARCSSLTASPPPCTTTRRPPVACPAWIDNTRNRVERLRARLKEWRAVGRYPLDEKTAVSFMGVLGLAATADWLKP